MERAQRQNSVNGGSRTKPEKAERHKASHGWPVELLNSSDG